MRFIEGRTWNVTVQYVTGQAAKVTKRIYCVADTAEKAIQMTREAVALNAVVTSVYNTDVYDGIVVGD